MKCEQSASRVRASANECEQSASRVRAECEQSASEHEQVRACAQHSVGLWERILSEVLLELSAALPQNVKNGRNELTAEKWALSFLNSPFSNKFWALCRESAGNFFFGRPPIFPAGSRNL